MCEAITLVLGSPRVGNKQQRNRDNPTVRVLRVVWLLKYLQSLTGEPSLRDSEEDHEQQSKGLHGRAEESVHAGRGRKCLVISINRFPICRDQRSGVSRSEYQPN